MIGKKRFKIILILMIALMVVFGCASGKGKQTGSADYGKMVELQQKKSAAVQAEEPDLPLGLEMTAETHEKMGDAYIRQGNAFAALTEYQKSLEKDPNLTSARYKIGMFFIGRGLPDEALKEFDQIIAREPENATAYYGRARARFLQKKLHLAKSDLRDALKLNDQYWQAHALLGIILDGGRQHGQAQEEYKKALVIQPDSAAVYNDLGVSLYLDGKFDEAAVAFLKAFNINPDNRRISNNLGLALYRLGNKDDALEAFKRGGSEAAAYNNIGYLQMKDKQYENALAALERAIDANPSFYARARKNMDKAKAALKKASSQETPDIVEQ